MLACTVKFCGGCNPRYDRGEAYRRICQALSDVARFSLPEEGKTYDVLVILRGCTGCEYLYEDIPAEHRFVSVCAEDVDRIIHKIQTLSQTRGIDK